MTIQSPTPPDIPKTSPHIASFGITFKGRMVHATLWHAAKQLGGIKALAAYLHLSYSTVLDWVNLKRFPAFRPRRLASRLRPVYRFRPHTTSWEEIEEKLATLTGQLLDDLFPEALENRDFLDHPKLVEATRELPIAMLADLGTVAALPPSPEDELIQRELLTTIEQTIATLPQRYQTVLRLRIHEERTLDNTAQLLGVGRERTRQLEKLAVAKLRFALRAHPDFRSQSKNERQPPHRDDTRR